MRSALFIFAIVVMAFMVAGFVATRGHLGTPQYTPPSVTRSPCQPAGNAEPGC
jgi:hypothetical protein